MAAISGIVSDASTATSTPEGAIAERWPLPERVMIYSHDTFGLGHLRRACAIANAMVADNPAVSVLIISGSPVIGNYEFGPGVDYVRIPGVVKQPDGDYRSLNLNMDLDEAVALRAAIIAKTVEAFRPGLFIVDKEPTGFRGEVMPALELLRARGTRLVLGIRDILDEPALLVPEWARKGATEALATFYDEIWVYGLPQIYAPLQPLALAPDIEERIVYTGYLRREVPRESRLSRYPNITQDPFILVTTGGGGDGEDVIDWVISAYETEDAPTIPALIVFGPFLNRECRNGFMARIARIPQLDAIGFDSKLEVLMDRASGVIAMGGYNTFCELLSFDKPALIVPRTRPRLEQYIRAVQAQRIGLVRMLSEEGEMRDPERMAQAIKGLLGQGRPSDVVVPGLLDGLAVIKERLASFRKEVHDPIAIPIQAAE
ncbi:glycosyltransferase family protein [Pseudochelatococcus sp. G4_1912]|uniref:glycosyltransferase family protein n=1 Tax=Pseudochelatococcus sp. G4_1912 TaxID=3114288 RepID=UPI0039C66614